jgi:hypothetical protein
MKLDDQIRYLLKLGNRAELYDATDWLNRNFPWAQHETTRTFRWRVVATEEGLKTEVPSSTNENPR